MNYYKSGCWITCECKNRLRVKDHRTVYAEHIEQLFYQKLIKKIK